MNDKVLPSRHYISVFVLTMMNAACVISLRGLPMMVKGSLPMIFFLLFASLLFLIPVSLVSAELETGSPIFYVVFLIVGTVIFVGAPLVINSFKKPSWMPKESDQ